MSTYYAEQCANCHSKDLSQDYENAPLVCKACGIVGKTEPISQDEIGDLANFMKVMNMKDTLPQVYQDLLFQSMIEEEMEKQEKKDNATIEELMSGMRIAGQKRPKRRRRQYRGKPYDR